MIGNEYIFWEIIGFIGFGILAFRWLVQMYYSKKAKQSITPLQFWVVTVFGLIVQIIYGLHLNSIAIVVAAFLSMLVAFFNIGVELKILR